MKSLIALAAVAAVAAVAAPASAQTLQPVVTPVTYNASLGYTGVDWAGNNLGAVTFRGGADFGKYLGVEGEVAVGVADAGGSFGGDTVKLHLDDEYAGYGVVRYPVIPNANLFARVGYGHSDLKLSGSAAGFSGALSGGVDSVNYGAGGEYFFDAKNGLRLEYTRFDFQADGAKDADTWTVSYVRKF